MSLLIIYDFKIAVTSDDSCSVSLKQIIKQK